jgi:primosomal protein N' (replication factor Y)
LLLPRTGATPSGPGPEELIRYLHRVVPAARISRADRPGLGHEPGALAEALAADVVVASEAALADVEWPPLGAAIALGVDALLSRPAASGHEEAFALLWAFGSLVARRSGRDPAAPRGRLLLETRRPDHHVVQALTRGDYHYFARHELEARHEGEWPPFRTLVKLSLPSGLTDETRTRLSGLHGVRVLGPVEGRVGEEMLLKVEDLEVVLDPLREIVAAAREPIFVDVDPRDW